MEPFIISFLFRDQAFEAEVTPLEGRDHKQYTVWPTDPHLQEEFGAQVFHKIDGKPLQTAFPLGDERVKEYIVALKKALREVND